MIEIYFTDGRIEHPESMTFEEMQKCVGGMVECVHFREGKETLQAIMNEEGLIHDLPFNRAATARVIGKINLGPCAVGNWIFLSGDDLLK